MPVNTAPILATPFPDQILPGGVSSSIIVPVSTFFDPDPNDQLAYTAVQFFGSALPAWLAFDPITLSFTATPDINVSGWTGILLTATDLLGAQATDFFFITVIPPDLTINGTADADLLQGGAGNDQLFGLGGDDALYGNAGNDVLTGSNLANTLDGGTGVDTMTGGAGNDRYYVDDVNDMVIEFASGGTDTVYATASVTLANQVENLVINGANAIDGTGNSLSNRLTGNAVNNVLTGLAGNDRLDGGLGNDVLKGGIGRDILTGGGGADEFQFAEWGSANYDSVADFTSIDDTIGLNGAAFGLALGALDPSVFAFGAAATDSLQRILYNQATGDIYFDADGNGAGARQLVASLVDGTAITYDDFFVF